MKEFAIKTARDLGYDEHISSGGIRENGEYLEKYLFITMDLKGNKKLIGDLIENGWEQVKLYRPILSDSNNSKYMLVDLKYYL